MGELAVITARLPQCLQSLLCPGLCTQSSKCSLGLLEGVKLQWAHVPHKKWRFHHLFLSLVAINRQHPPWPSHPEVNSLSLPIINVNLFTVTFKVLQRANRQSQTFVSAAPLRGNEAENNEGKSYCILLL